MGTRNSRRSNVSGRKGANKTSVVGSTVRDVSTRLRGRGLPRGGIREQDGLKVAEGALPDSTVLGSADSRELVKRILRIAVIVLASVIVLLIMLAIVLGILSNTAAFSVSRIETFDSEHITADEVARLSNVGSDVTLLNVDTDAIQNGVRKNPWVSSVNVERVFPDTLRLHVNERSLGAVVAMNSGGVAWLMGDDNVWIEPIKLEVSETESSNDAALAKANSLGVVLISDAPGEVYPVAGAECTDPSIMAVSSIASQLSSSFRDQIVCYSAASQDDISCILRNGVEISFGSDSEIPTKEAVAKRMLEEFGGQIIYINVRTPSRPTYRRVDSEYVREGTGATGTSVDDQSIVPKVRALEGDEEDEENEGTDDATSTNKEGEDGRTEDAGSSSSKSKSNEDADESSQDGYDSSGYYDSTYGDGSYDAYGANDYGYSDYGSGYGYSDYGQDGYSNGY